MHGATNDANPANAATANVISTMNSDSGFSFKILFQIYVCISFLSKPKFIVV
jgi:hypothetical protein